VERNQTHLVLGVVFNQVEKQIDVVDVKESWLNKTIGITYDGNGLTASVTKNDHFPAHFMSMLL